MTIASTQVKDTQPWWKYGYVWLVISGPAVVVVAGFYTLWLAISSPNQILTDDSARRRSEISQKSENKEKSTSFFQKNVWILPLTIFIGSGITDSTFNQIQRNYTPENFEHIVTIMVFLGAMTSGLIFYGTHRKMYRWKNLLGGIILGIPNYFSLYFLMLSLKYAGFESSTLFPINNLGIVGLSAVGGLVLFKEKFSTRKIIGFILAITSIIIIGYFG